MLLIARFWRRILTTAVVILICVGCSSVPNTAYNPWSVISVPTDAKLLDVGFTSDKQHGFIVGSNSSVLETKDGGNTWKEVPLQLDSENYRLTSVSFYGIEGWIVGEPALMLHTTDEGRSWSQIPLSEKLPGAPVSVVALGDNKAEMATNVGGIYQTSDGGKNWKAQVAEAVGFVRNMKRSPDGKYVAVSAKGNFYSTWEPGLNAWVPHNRNSSRRVENMGFTSDGKLWMIARGGQLQFSDPEKPEEWLETQYPEFSTSWGLLDMAYRTPDEIWVTGGSGNLLRSADGGKTWEKDRDVEQVPANLFKVVFFSQDQGFVLGDRGGYLLKYQPDIASNTKLAPAA
ncbi:MAG: photosynthesis system II assembly factor Ycf48 [Calothrix sp. FI2-JRJ7]|jgi:photosystem II stability/assembly factor-like uncharacterized protein|nr:photosynthesis system II assembly factor Ycf48 [Calothrix sp. FI2-JRJ7]